MIYWTDINGYQGLYEINDDGSTIRSRNRFIPGVGRKDRFRKSKIVKVKTDKDGNRFVILRKDGKSTKHLVDALMTACMLDAA